MIYTNLVKKRFSDAAGEYEANSDFQAEVAGDLLCFMSSLLSLERKCAPIKILDTGCGTGRLVSELSQKEEYKAARFFGLDAAYPMLTEARGQVKKGFVNGACEAMPFGAESFDLIVSNLAYQWVTDLAAAFSEVKRVLLPGGYFSFSTLGPATLNELQASLEEADKGRHRFTFTPFASIDEIEKALKLAGLKLVNLQEKTILRPYESALHLLKRLKQIGASARGEVPEGALSSGTFLKKVMGVYEEKFALPEGAVGATYEVFFVTAKKGV